MSTSDPEVITYMADADDSFDLPRWSNNLPSSHLATQASHSNGNQYSIYGQSAPPPQQTSSHHDHARLPPITHQRSSSSSRHPPRVPHLLDPETQSSSQDQASPLMQLARSASISTNNRGRRQPDDLERAYSSETQAAHGASGRPPMANPFYPSSVAYQQTASPNAAAQSPGVDGYMYFGQTSGAARRTQTHEPSNPAPNSAQSHQPVSQLDPYTQPQTTTLYSPSEYSDYVSSPQQPPSDRSAYSPQVKAEPVESDMRASPYTPQPPAMSSQASNLSYNSSQSYQAMDTQLSHPQLTASPSRPPSQSTSSTPFSHSHGQVQHQQQYYSPVSQPDQMNVEPQARRRSVGFKRVRDARDLRSYVSPAASGRRVDHDGNYVGPLRALTMQITSTYNLCNPQFRYESAHNPRRVLTKPSKPAHNEGYDNEDYDYILYVNDWLGSEDGQKYLILDVLGQGTFGQVVKCQNSKTNEILAVKVIKNKPAYFNQSMMEVTILQMLNNDFDAHDEHHILRLRDSFIHKNHLCLVFEQLSSNLYELIKQNQFQGLSTQLVKVFTAQLLDALTVLKEARLIHCDLKPENILLKSLQSPQIKVIDFGSACHERQTVYTYIQSRFYRSPEVLLGIPYTAAIDMWSLGCIAVELFLGLPLFPGTSEYNQITRIVELLGLPPQHMLDHGKQVGQFFDCFIDTYGQKKYRLKPIEQYSRERNTQEQVGKQYFSHKTLPDIIRNAPLASSRHSSAARHGQELEREANNRAAFIDFCQGLLNLDPLERWTPQQAKQHPFITGEKFARPYNPVGQATTATASLASSAPSADPKRPYGGLLPSQPKGNRAYQDAASYNQQLAQHQAYTAQAQAASHASATAMRNPYVTSNSQTYNDSNTDYSIQQQHIGQSSQNTQPSGGPRGLAHQASTGSLGLQYGNQNTSGLPVPATNPNPPSNSYYPNARARANTINQMDVVPPALARLSHLGNADVTGIGRNALTPVMQREDAMREWERRQSGKPQPPPQTYPQLEFLQQQAELAATSGMNWAPASSSGNRYAPSNLSYQAQPPTLGDPARNATIRDAVMSSVRSAARQDPSNSLTQAGVISTPPQAYSGNSTTAVNRYATTYPQSSTSFDAPSFESRSESSSLYIPVQPQQYQPYGGAASSPSHGSQQQQNLSVRHNIAPPGASVNPSFYGAGVVPSGQPFPGQGSPNPSQSSSKDARHVGGMDVWQR